MYKPSLKRQTQQSLSTDFSSLPKTTGRSQIENRVNLSKERTLVPEAFFQQCKSIFSKRQATGLVGTLNTCEYNYPKAVEDEITIQDPGHIEVNEEIYCFYKQKNVYFWQYDGNNFTTIFKFIKSSRQDVITAVAYRTVTFSDFDGKSIKLVAISYGTLIKFYRLHNFQKQNNNCIPYLEDLLITLYSPSIVTQIKIIYEQNIEEQAQHNKLSILVGDENGNLMLFDFVTKKKYIVDSLTSKMKRKVKQQSYSQIMQILPYKQFVFCLVKRYYEPGTLWKILQKILRSRRAQVLVEQLIQVYKIDTFLPNAETYQKNPSNFYKNAKINSFKRYSNYSTEQIIEKMKGSYHNYFEQQKNQKQMVELGLIDYISLKKNYVQIMFKSGQSILVDQEMSFGGAPRSRVKKPHSLGIIGKYIPNESYLYERSHLIKSLGSQLMLFQGFIASYTQQCLYATPYSYKENTFTIRSVKQCQNSSNTYQNGQFMVLGLKGFTFIQQITPTLALFMYCAAMSQQYPYKKYIPQFQKFKQQIQKMIEYHGQLEIIVRLIQFLMKIKLNDSFKLNVRMDLFEISVREVSNHQQILYEDVVKCYEENEKKIVKNSVFKFTKDIEQMIWKIIFQVQKTKVEFPISNQWKLKYIQSVCIGFQVAISQIFRGIKDWTARNFTNKRNQVFRIICDANILAQIIETYIIRQAEYNSKKTTKFSFQTMTQTSSAYLSPENQSLKIRFCFLSKTTLQKLVLLLKVYDYVSEMDYNGSPIPKFSDLIFNTNHVSRIHFANTITTLFGLNNQALIDQLIVKIPELKLDQVRRYHLWKETHLNTNRQIQPPKPIQNVMLNKYDEHNRTIDSVIGENQVEEVTQIINQVNCREIQEYFLSGTQVRNNNTFSSTFEEQRYLSNQWLKGITALIQICLAKILQFRKQQIQATNIIQTYKKSSQNYFGLIQAPTLQKKVNQLLKQIEFFTVYCQDLIERVFNKYRISMITKEMLRALLDSIRGQLTIQVRRKIEKGLEELKLTNLVQNVARRHIFSNNSKPRPVELPSNFIAQQLTYEMGRKLN